MPKHPRPGPPAAIPGTFRLARRESKSLLPTSLYSQRPRKTKRRTGGSSDPRRVPHEDIPPGARRGSGAPLAARPKPHVLAIGLPYVLQNGLGHLRTGVVADGAGGRPKRVFV